MYNSTPTKPSASVFSFSEQGNKYAQSTIGSHTYGSEYTGYSKFTNRTMGTSTTVGKLLSGKTAIVKGIKYFRRLIHVGQMDFEFGSWQMIYLLVSPQKVYRNFQYRKQTKDQFARDDPAFLVLLSALLCLTSICFGVLMGLNFWDTMKLLAWIVAIDCIGSGILIATTLRWFANKYLRTASTEDVEWAYAFDVHLNAFIPLLMILHGIQLIFVAVMNQSLYFTSMINNTFWFIALSYYFYITFLGYTALPFLKKTTVFLMPILPTFFIYLILLATGVNPTSILIKFYNARL